LLSASTTKLLILSFVEVAFLKDKPRLQCCTWTAALAKNRENAPQHFLAKFISSDGDDKIIEELCTVIQQTVQYQPIEREPSARKIKKAVTASLYQPRGRKKRGVVLLDSSDGNCDDAGD
jgi:hypothetical protein